MKNFLKNEKITYNLMSFTGFRSLILFSLLVEGPKSYEEICDHLRNHPYLKEDISIDTLRVYITSLKRAGCDVKRIREPGNKTSKYVILSNPFELKVTSEQLKAIEKVYKNVIKNADIDELVVIETFLRKLIKYVENDDLKSALENNSALKGISVDLVRSLIDCAEKKQQIVISYHSPNSTDRDIEVLADKVCYTNGKLYLYGTGSNYNKYGSFLVQRIRELKAIRSETTIVAAPQTITVQYEVKTDKFEPGEDEKLISHNEDITVVEVTASDEFRLRQRLLSLGPDCKILAPESFRQEFLASLKEMKAGYDAAAI